jgi:hypothetical protein
MCLHVLADGFEAGVRIPGAALLPRRFVPNIPRRRRQSRSRRLSLQASRIVGDRGADDQPDAESSEVKHRSESVNEATRLRTEEAPANRSHTEQYRANQIPSVPLQGAAASAREDRGPTYGIPVSSGRSRLSRRRTTPPPMLLHGQNAGTLLQRGHPEEGGTAGTTPSQELDRQESVDIPPAVPLPVRRSSRRRCPSQRAIDSNEQARKRRC